MIERRHAGRYTKRSYAEHYAQRIRDDALKYGWNEEVNVVEATVYDVIVTVKEETEHES